jgi:hypothetical protein
VIYEMAIALVGAQPTWLLKQYVETLPRGEIVREAARVVIQYRTRGRS